MNNNQDRPGCVVAAIAYAILFGAPFVIGILMGHFLW